MCCMLYLVGITVYVCLLVFVTYVYVKKMVLDDLEEQFMSVFLFGQDAVKKALESAAIFGYALEGGVVIIYALGSFWLL